MKIDRAEVEELLAVLEKVRKPNNGTLAKLCRLALEVMDAPVCEIHDGYTVSADPEFGSPDEAAMRSMHGQRVRLVRVGEE